ncbi:MAG: S-layer homology domain-containing protein [Actinobacteria bacterium]|nr:S-layer homology domain-containing protein [Actinomycetota bacterium]
MKRTTILAILTAVILLVSSLSTYAAPNKSFSDVTSDYWATKQILSLANYDIVSGGADGRFRPVDGLTRSELTKLLTQAFILKESTESLSYTDLSASHWAFTFISKAIAGELMNGFPDNTFRPDARTTRAQVAKILVLAKGYSILNISTKTFSDVSSAYWGYPYIEAAAKNSLISGYPDGTFRPDAEITRAEAAALIYRSLIGKDYLIENSTINEVSFERYRRFQEAGPLNINVLKVPKVAPVSIDLGLARDRVTGLEQLSSMAKRKNALAGINADFFSTNGGGCSGIMVDGQIISSPISIRSYFGILPDKTCFINRAFMDAMITAETTAGVEKRGVISWINKARDSFTDTIVAYTPFYGPSTLTNNNGTEVIVKLEGTVTPNSEIIGKVIDVRYNAGNTTISPDGIILSGIGPSKNFLTENMKRGGIIKLTFNLKPYWQDNATAIGGGPRLIRGGQVGVENEGFDSGLVSRKHPRTGIGIDSQGNLVIVVIDGRMSYFSIGMTLPELATELKNRGAVDAMSMDGGGSSALYFNGSVRNYPNGASGERAINNAVLFIPYQS